jgi:hypothetical protein
MEHTYNAELINNQITWLEEKPKRLYKNRRYRIKVILETVKEDKRTGRDLIESFRNSPLFGIELDLARDKDMGRDIEL